MYFCIIDHIGKWGFMLRFVSWSKPPPPPQITIGSVELRTCPVSKEVKSETTTVDLH